jgi:FkbM family methyltransferase
MEKLKILIAKRLRWIIYTKRYVIAWFDCLLPTKASYSQDGEDCEIAKILNGFDLTTGIYIDVGANQPSHLSNTYLFYKQGLSGILIEPDESTFSLLKHFRGRDISIRALVGSICKICKFNYTVFSVYNSVHPRPESMLFREEYIPQITLDEIVDCINPKWIYLLNTDTEGNDLEVLRGASQTLKRTLLVCTEYHGDKDRLALEEYMNNNSFYPVFSNSLNIIFRNTNSFDNLIQYKENKM